MAKIQCPHCQAINENIDTDQPCRKCGTVINAPLSSLDTGHGAPTSDGSTADTNTDPTTAVEKQVSRDSDRDPDDVKDLPVGDERN